MNNFQKACAGAHYAAARIARLGYSVCVVELSHGSYRLRMSNAYGDHLTTLNYPTSEELRDWYKLSLAFGAHLNTGGFATTATQPRPDATRCCRHRYLAGRPPTYLSDDFWRDSRHRWP